MGVKIYKKTTPGRRQSSVNDFAELTSKHSRPVKSLTRPLTKTGGRNNQGFTTSRFRGGGHKRRYRVVDFRRNKDGVAATVERVEYDPNRNVFIALLKYGDGELRYILAPNGLKAGDKVMSGPTAEPKLGCAMAIKDMPVGMDIHNIELNAGQGGKLVRTAGSVARLVAKEGEWATIVLPSGEMRQVRTDCRATIGQLGNMDFKNIIWGKAGRTRYLGRRPHVRGTAQNPVAHPLGGGEGRSGGGRHPCSPTGVLAKGGRTRNPRKNSNRRILRRRKSVRYGQVSLPRRK
ncbi:MAG: 50S ribosomal protein L2 [Planctomycetota bacterium]|nr:MAG: 50S ribosomal protein L2 [Planctomycetota bacterium]